MHGSLSVALKNQREARGVLVGVFGHHILLFSEVVSLNNCERQSECNKGILGRNVEIYCNTLSSIVAVVYTVGF